MRSLDDYILNERKRQLNEEVDINQLIAQVKQKANRTGNTISNKADIFKKKFQDLWKAGKGAFDDLGRWVAYKADQAGDIAVVGAKGLGAVVATQGTKKAAFALANLAKAQAGGKAIALNAGAVAIPIIAAQGALYAGNNWGNAELLQSIGIGTPEYFERVGKEANYKAMATYVKQWRKENESTPAWKDLKTINTFYKNVLLDPTLWKNVHAREQEITTKASGRDDSFIKTTVDFWKNVLGGDTSWKDAVNGDPNDDPNLNRATSAVFKKITQDAKNEKIEYKGMNKRRLEAIKAVITDEYEKLADSKDSEVDDLGKWDGLSVSRDQYKFSGIGDAPYDAYRSLTDAGKSDGQLLASLAVAYDKWLFAMTKGTIESAASKISAPEVAKSEKPGTKKAAAAAVATEDAPKLDLSNTNKPSWWDGAKMPDDKDLIGKENHYMTALWSPVKSKLGGHKAAASATSLAAFNTKRAIAMKMPQGEERTKRLHDIIDARIKEMDGYYATIVGGKPGSSGPAVAATSAPAKAKVKVTSGAGSTVTQTNLLKGTGFDSLAQLQTTLLNYGFFDEEPADKEETRTFSSGQADGRYGPETSDAIENLQKKLGFTGEDVDGLYGSDTHAALVKNPNVRGENDTSTEVSSKESPSALAEIIRQEINALLKERGMA